MEEKAKLPQNHGVTQSVILIYKTLKNPKTPKQKLITNYFDLLRVFNVPGQF